MVLYTSLAIASFAFSMITAIFSISAYCKVVGMEKSTHKVQWIPMQSDSEVQVTGEELAKQFMPEDTY